jgi:hypothetical protein
LLARDCGIARNIRAVRAGIVSVTILVTEASTMILVEVNMLVVNVLAAEKWQSQYCLDRKFENTDGGLLSKFQKLNLLVENQGLG